MLLAVGRVTLCCFRSHRILVSFAGELFGWKGSENSAARYVIAKVGDATGSYYKNSTMKERLP